MSSCADDWLNIDVTAVVVELVSVFSGSFGDLTRPRFSRQLLLLLSPPLPRRHRRQQRTTRPR
jgi:hypothetical protein